MTSESAPDKNTDAKKKQVIGKYRITGTVGRGSMGVVYKGEDPEIGRTVAIKTLRKIVSSQFHDPEKALERFKVEARSAGNLRHPNIITIFDVNVDDAMPYIVMDYVEGKTLDICIKEQGSLSAQMTLRYLKQLAKALDYAHEQGVIHRDIKPSNILIDRNGILYMLDFGIAKINDSLSKADKLVKNEPVMGTPGYMSPENILNKPLDHKTDLFSLAIVAYECLTGQRPFQGKTFNEVLANILNSRPTPISSVSSYSEQLDQVFLTLLAKETEYRPSNAKQVVDLLEQNLLKENTAGAQSSNDGSGTWKTLSSASTQGDYESHVSGKRNIILDEHQDSPNTSVDGNAEGNYKGSYGYEAHSIFSDSHQNEHSRPSPPPVNKESDPGRKLLAAFFVLLLLFSVVTFFLFKKNPPSSGVAGHVQLEPGNSSESDLTTIAEEGGAEVTFTLPEIAPVPSGKVIAEMNNKEILGVLLDPNTNDSVVIKALREAERRRLFSVVESSSVIIKSDSKAVRLETVKVLGRMQDANAVPILLVGLDDHDPMVRIHTARALANIGSRKALSYLRATLGKESIPAVRTELRAAVEQITGYPMNE